MLPVLFLFCSFLASTQQEWKWSEHPESGFKVLTPFDLLHNRTEVPTSMDPIVYHQYRGGSMSDSVMKMAFVIDHYEIEDELGGDEAYLDDFFSGTIDQILDVIDGTLIYKDITAHSDREICIWKASYAGQNIIKGKLIIAGHKYYGLQAFGLANKETEDSMQRFIESFHLLTEDKK